MKAHKKMGVLIPSVMALRETAMTAPLDQQGEPLPSSVTAKPCYPLCVMGALALPIGQQGEPFTSPFCTNYNTFVRIIQVVIFGCVSGGILL